MKYLRSVLLAYVVIAFSVLSADARAALLLIDNTGKLIGADSVLIGQSLYNVTIVDGTCEALFNGCNDLEDFDFTDQTTALQSHATCD